MFVSIYTHTYTCVYTDFIYTARVGNRQYRCIYPMDDRTECERG